MDGNRRAREASKISLYFTTFLVLILCFSCASRITEMERRQAENRARLAASMLMEGQRNEALVEALRSVEIDPECIDCRLTLATIYGAREEFDRSEQQYQIILEKEADNPIAHNSLSAIYNNMGRFSDAERHARQASENEMYTTRHLAYYNLGWALLEQRQYQPALEALNSALRENPSMCAALYRIGEVFFRMERYDEAIRYLDRCVEEIENPDSQIDPQQVEIRSCHRMPHAHHLLGLSLLASNRAEEAQSSFRRCVEYAGSIEELRIQCTEQLESGQE